jgi:hypothetical protein
MPMTVSASMQYAGSVTLALSDDAVALSAAHIAHSA